MEDKFLAAVLERQYRAALLMLREAIEACPAELWDREEDEAPLWRHAAHVIYYGILFLAEDINAPWVGQAARETMAMLGAPLKDTSPPEIDRLARTVGFTGITERGFRVERVPAKEEVLAQLGKCEAAVGRMAEQVAGVGAEGKNPMPWMSGARAELLLYNLRHLQHHTGRIFSMLGRRGIRVSWH